MVCFTVCFTWGWDPPLVVTKCCLSSTPNKLPHCYGLLSTHGPLGDIAPLLTEAVIYGPVVNHNLHT